MRIAEYYATIPFFDLDAPDEDETAHTYSTLIEQLFYPYLQQNFDVCDSVLDAESSPVIRELVSTDHLYKIFERC